MKLERWQRSFMRTAPESAYSARPKLSIRRGLTHFLLGCLVCTWAIGCGNGLARVEGKVMLDGKSVDRGMISFEPTDGKGPSSGGNVENGQYSVDDVTPGEKLVRIYAVEVVGEKPLDSGIPNSPMVEETKDIIPNRYNNQSELKLEVSAPVTVHDFDLMGK